VHLVDTYKILTDVWMYLKRATKLDILSLPGTVQPRVDIRKQFPDLSPAEHALIGFWLDRASTGPSYTPGSWYAQFRNDSRHFESFWDGARLRIAEQAQHIRHWTVESADFTVGAQLQYTTLFIDPP